MKVLANSYGFFVYGEKIYEDEKTIVFKDCEVYYRNGKIDKFNIFRLEKSPITKVFEVERLFSINIRNGRTNFIFSSFEENGKEIILYGVKTQKGFIPLVRYNEDHYKIEGDMSEILRCLSRK